MVIAEQSRQSVTSPITLDFIAPDQGVDQPMKTFEVHGHPDGGVEIHLVDDFTGVESIADLSSAQTDDLFARLLKAREQMTDRMQANDPH